MLYALCFIPPANFLLCDALGPLKLWYPQLV
jgi:hypothetical protein